MSVSWNFDHPVYTWTSERRWSEHTHQQTDIRVHRSPRLVMFYGSGYILCFFSVLFHFCTHALPDHNSGNVITFKRFFTHTYVSFLVHTHTQMYIKLGFPGVRFFQFLCSRFSLDYQTPPPSPAERKRSVGAHGSCWWQQVFRHILYFMARKLLLFLYNIIFVYFYFFSFRIIVIFIFFLYQYYIYRSSNRNIFNHLENRRTHDNIIILSKQVFLEFLSIFWNKITDFIYSLNVLVSYKTTKSSDHKYFKQHGRDTHRVRIDLQAYRSHIMVK